MRDCGPCKQKTLSDPHLVYILLKHTICFNFDSVFIIKNAAFYQQGQIDSQRQENKDENKQFRVIDLFPGTLRGGIPVSGMILTWCSRLQNLYWPEQAMTQRPHIPLKRVFLLFCNRHAGGMAMSVSQKYFNGLLWTFVHIYYSWCPELQSIKTVNHSIIFVQGGESYTHNHRYIGENVPFWYKTCNKPVHLFLGV